MNKNVNTWIEGNGTVRTVFRKMGLWEYSSSESCRLQLLKDLDKESPHPSVLLLQYAMEKRKEEIQWISVYLPLFGFTFVILSLLHVMLISHMIFWIYFGIGLTIAIGIFFRITFYAQYLEACKFIYRAGDSLLREFTDKAAIKEFETMECGIGVVETGLRDVNESVTVCTALPQNLVDGVPSAAEVTINELEVIGQADSDTRFDIIVGTECGTASSTLPHELIEVAPPILEITEAEPVAIPTTNIEMSTDEGTPDIPLKGRINTILLHELIMQEAGRPNIYKGDIHKNVLYYAHVTGCRPKNILDKTKSYRSRQCLNLTTPNSLTTHKKYLDILLEFYRETGDDILYNTAEDLQSFIENSTKRKK